MKTSSKEGLAAVGLVVLVLGVGVTSFAACLQGLAEGPVNSIVARAVSGIGA